MANWANISSNAKTHGDFAGRTTAEQNTYFDFFRGSEHKGPLVISMTVRRAFAKMRNNRTTRGLRWRVAGVASSKFTTSP